jgi:ribose 5-phosphate isomerase B
VIKILIASDHAGFVLKNKLMNYFKKKFEFTDFGTNSEESVDYPDYAHKLSKRVSNSEDFGVLICGSGIGMSMVANRYKKVRAALCLNEKMAKLSREHNNANVLVLGSRLISYEEAIKCLIMFFNTEFEGGRHQARLGKLNHIESNK